jgi:hypothetical protein
MLIQRHDIHRLAEIALGDGFGDSYFHRDHRVAGSLPKLWDIEDNESL